MLCDKGIREERKPRLYTHSHIHILHFFIHSSVDGCLGCFHVLAITSSAAINIGMNVSF